MQRRERSSAAQEVHIGDMFRGAAREVLGHASRGGESAHGDMVSAAREVYVRDARGGHARSGGRHASRGGATVM